MTNSGSDTRPVVAVLMPFHNAERTLATAVRSIVAQTFGQWQMVLIDDGSTDTGLAVARSFESERIRVTGDRSRRGISARLNAAIAETQTEFVCRMDADDFSFPNRLERQLALLRANPGVDVVASSIVVFEGSGKLRGMMQVRREHEAISARPWRGFFFPHPTWLGRTQWFRENRYDSRDDGAEDQALLYRAYRKSRLAGIDDVLLAYREDGRTLAKQVGRRLAFWKAIGREATEHAAWGDLGRLTVAQPVLMAGDFAYAAGLRSVRKRLTSVRPRTLARWRDLWSNECGQAGSGPAGR